MKIIWTVGVAIAAVALAGCGGQSSSAPSASASAPPAEAPPSSAAAPSTAAGSEPASSASASEPASSPSPSSGPSTTSAKTSVKDPCKLISVKQMSQLVGVEMKSSSSRKLADSRLCTYVPKTVGPKAISVTTQEGQFPGGALDDGVQQVKKQLNAKSVKDITVSGADDAKVIVGTFGGVSVVDVLAGKDQVFYQALAGGPGNVTQYQDDMAKVAAALIKG